MENNIVIVGGGASCISFIDALLIKRKKTQNTSSLPSLTIIEKSEEIGPGNAYFSDVKSNLLNTKAGNISVFKNQSGDFYNWLKSNYYKWNSEFQELDVTRDTYAPRSLFGMYMKDSFSYICSVARHAGMDVKVVRDEVINIEQIKDNRINVITKNGTVIIANKVVLACGTQQPSQMIPPYSTDILHSPYPTQDLKEQVSSEDSVAIIGARLSAIDTTIGLIEGGHTGPITIYSRSGFFPFVRGTQGRYKNTYLNPEYIAKHCPELDFYKLGDLYQLEREHYQLQSGDSDFEDLPLPNNPLNCLETFLTSEVSLAQHNRGWQAILYDTNSCIDQIWDRLCFDDQDVFMREYFSSAISLRVSIPLENAEKILGYLRSGQLKFIAGPPVVSTKNSELSVRSNGITTPVSKVIYATGSPRSLNHVDSPLIRNLLDSGISTENTFGGLDVCKYDYGLFDKDKKMNTNIFAIGELTSGRFLFTSALDIIVRHAHACADSVEKFSIEQNYSLSARQS
ncbi:FAD/NAD(P)-binding protein [Photobacterium nomapromontoriensis]|uniref:FAD/NAD(P)-binding protein n=1 Tax=Photobacterium nomapromontoriensis TaxID=2910237 RepID=UPI003D119F69